MVCLNTLSATFARRLVLFKNNGLNASLPEENKRRKPKKRNLMQPSYLRIHFSLLFNTALNSALKDLRKYIGMVYLMFYKSEAWSGCAITFT